MFLIVIYLFVSVCRAVVPTFDKPRNLGSRFWSWLHRRLPRCDSPTGPRFYFTTNFFVISPTLMKYIPCGKTDTLICWVSALRLPVRTVWPMRLVIRNAE